MENGAFNNNVVTASIAFSNKSVFKSIFTKVDPARVQIKTDNSQGSTTRNNFIKKNFRCVKTSLFIIRDLIWKLGKWKKSKILNSFLEEIKPDVIYLPIYSSPNMCDVQSYLVDKLKVPVVGHISDDVYAKSTSKSPLAKAYNKTTRKKVKNLIQKCEYLEVFAENMKEEYQKIFNVPCYLIGKGVKPEDIGDIKYEISNEREIKFVYTGNIGTNRYNVLSDIGVALDEVHKNAKLYIYSATTIDDKMKKSLSQSNSIVFMGAISAQEVKVVQQQADYLVHVESFSKQGVSSAKMSFSTKIIDYMLSGKPIFAVGPKEVNSIQVLKNHNLAIVAESNEELQTTLSKLFNSEIDLEVMASNVHSYLKNDRNIYEIQSGIKTRLENLVKS